MRIAVFGALGNTGSRVVSEAVARGHRVTAVVRSPEQVERVDAGAVPAVADVTDAFAVGELASRHDLLVSATRPVAGKEFELTAAAKVLLDDVAAVGTRLIVVGGAASLVVPGTQGRMVLDDPRYFHPAAKPIALACNEQLAACVDSVGADWTYVSSLNSSAGWLACCTNQRVSSSKHSGCLRNTCEAFTARGLSTNTGAGGTSLANIMIFK